MAAITDLAAASSVAAADLLVISQSGTDKKATADKFAFWSMTTWTPVLKFGGLTTGITYSAQNGKYALLGDNLVIARFEITLTSKGSATGNATVDDIPFAGDSGSGAVHWRYVSDTASITGQLIAYVGIGNTSIAMGQLVSNSFSVLTDANFTNTTNLQGIAIYFK